MTPRTLAIALLAALALLAVPAAAMAEYLVPEGNSAVTQYTEGFPTGGGEKKTEGSKHVTPNKAIGASNVKKLKQQGADGAAVAEVAAETAPVDVPATAPTSGGGEGQAQQGEGKDHGKAQHAQGGQKDEKPQQQNDSRQGDESAAAVPPAQGGDGPSGSSGAGEVLGAATGASSGSIGLLLPLAIAAAVVWGLIFLWRRRQPSTPAATQP
jgi:hypothetical protein